MTFAKNFALFIQKLKFSVLIVLTFIYICDIMTV